MGPRFEYWVSQAKHGDQSSASFTLDRSASAVILPLHPHARGSFSAARRGDVGLELTRVQSMQEDGDTEEGDWVRLPGEKRRQASKR